MAPHYIEVPISPGLTDTLEIGTVGYQLVQYYFHAPPSTPSTAVIPTWRPQFVHKSIEGDTAVVSVFFDIGPVPNRLLDTILLSAPTTAGKHVPVGEANPIELLRAIRGSPPAGMARGPESRCSTPTPVR